MMASDTDACGCVEASCVCSLPKGHEDLTHHCDCGGEWRYDPESGEFEAVTLPGPFAGMDDPLAAMAVAMFGDFA
jgi:hypothetical protein